MKLRVTLFEGHILVTETLVTETAESTNSRCDFSAG